jgi:hypothetical protein
VGLARFPDHAAGARDAPGLVGAEGRGDGGGVAEAVGENDGVLDRLERPRADFRN